MALGSRVLTNAFNQALSTKHHEQLPTYSPTHLLTYPPRLPSLFPNCDLPELHQ